MSSFQRLRVLLASVPVWDWPRLPINCGTSRSWILARACLAQLWVRKGLFFATQTLKRLKSVRKSFFNENGWKARLGRVRAILKFWWWKNSASGSFISSYNFPDTRLDIVEIVGIAATSWPHFALTSGLTSLLQPSWQHRGSMKELYERASDNLWVRTTEKFSFT